MVAVLVGMGGGSVGKAEGTEDNQSGSESNTERDGGGVWEWGKWEVRETAEFCSVLVEDGKLKSSSKVTHCWGAFPPGGGGWRRGARTGGREEGGAAGKAGAESEERGSKGAGAGLRPDDGPNNDMVLCTCGAGAAGAGMGMSG